MGLGSWVILNLGAAGLGRAAGPGAVGAFDEAAEAFVGEARGPGGAGALATLMLLAPHQPPQRLCEVLSGAIGRAGVDPLLEAQVLHALAQCDADRGDEKAEAERYAGLGLVSRFQVIGPFEAQGRGALGSAFPPESEPPVADRSHPGKEHAVSWRDGSGVLREGAVALDALFRPATDATGYVLVTVQSPRRQVLALRLGSAGPVKAWLNGDVVFERDVVRRARLDQDAAPVLLRPGKNRLLVKTVVLSGPWELFVRFTRPDGRPAPGLTFASELAGPAPSERKARAPGGKIADLTAWLRVRAQAATGSQAAAAWLDYGRWLVFSRVADEDGDETEAALEQAAAEGAGAPALLLLGEVARKDDTRRAALERVPAVTDDPGWRALALAGLAQLARNQRRDAVAIDTWRQALELDPGAVDAALALAIEEEGAGRKAMALARIEALPQKLQALPRVALGRVRALESLDRMKEAEALLKDTFARTQGDVGLALDLSRVARGRGDLQMATELLAKVVRRRPDLDFLTSEYAKLREAQGDVAGAKAVLQEAARRLIDEPRLAEELGHLLIRHGELPAGLSHLRRALALRPQNPALRRYVGHLGAQDGGVSEGIELARRFAEDGQALAAVALGAPGDEENLDGAGAVVLLDKQVVRVHKNGLFERFSQRLIQLRTAAAARAENEFAVRYSPGDETVDIHVARIFRRGPDGEVQVLETYGRDDRGLSEPWYGLYYDVRADVVVFENLEAGDVVEIQYTLANVSHRNEMADYFGDLEFIAEGVPRRRWEYHLLGPASRRFFFNEPTFARLERSRQETDGEVHYSFVAKDVPRVMAEPGMPGWSEVAPYLHVSTYANWDDVGRWYWHLVADQLKADDSIRRAAREATKGARSLEEKVAEVHRFVLDNTRYVGLEFGIHGYKPYRVSQVLSRRFGDCKDKASLLVALLREVGVHAELVLLRTRRQGRVAPHPASLAVFDHAIAYVPALELYLDGTAEFSGLGELPSEDQGVTVLRVSAGSVTLAETPVLPARENLVDRAWAVELDAGGGAAIKETIEVRGQAAAQWREYYETPGERQERLGKVWSGRFPGARLESVELDGLGDRNLPVIVRSRVGVSSYGEPLGENARRVPIAAREPSFVRTYAQLSSRRHEYVLAYPWLHQEAIVYQLPEGWQAVDLPTGRREESAFGTFEVRVIPEEAGHKVRIALRLEVNRHRIAPQEYGAFRGFLGRLDTAFGQSFTVRRRVP